MESSRVRTGYLDCVLCGKRVVCEYGRMRLHFRSAWKKGRGGRGEAENRWWFFFFK